MADSLDALYRRLLSPGASRSVGTSGRELLEMSRALEQCALPRRSNLPTEGERYGRYPLQLGDRDATTKLRARYGGQDAVWAYPIARAPVAALKWDLDELGFGALLKLDSTKPPQDSFDLPTQIALREFQIAARMPRLLDWQGQSVANPMRYTGRVSGVLNATTHTILQRWLALGLRCPLRFALADSAGFVVRDGETPNGIAVEVEDHTGCYDALVPATRRPAAGQPGRWAVGARTDALSGGPWVNQAAWATECALTIPFLTGHIDDFADLPADRREQAQSTWRVLREVAQEESPGSLDRLNGYDTGVISAGLFHWTLTLLTRLDIGGTSRRVFAAGELCALLAIMRENDPTEFERFFGHFGLGVYPLRGTDPAWTRDGTAGANFANAALGTWSGRMTMQREQGVEPIGTGPDQNGALDDASRTWGRAMRSWPWFYRFLMAARCSPGFRRAQWTLARMRMQALAQRPWANGLTVGQVFHSELAFAMLLRWHVNRPADMADIATGIARRWTSNGTRDRQIDFARALSQGLPGTPEHLVDSLERLFNRGYRPRARVQVLSPEPNSLHLLG